MFCYLNNERHINTGHLLHNYATNNSSSQMVLNNELNNYSNNPAGCLLGKKPSMSCELPPIHLAPQKMVGV